MLFLKGSLTDIGAVVLTEIIYWYDSSLHDFLFPQKWKITFKVVSIINQTARGFRSYHTFLQAYNITVLYRRSSVSIVSGYGLGDRAIEVRSPAEAKDFSSSLCASGAHPASCPMGTGVLFPGVNRGRCVTLTTHPPYSTEVMNE
jgi:hypothetical protein